MGDDFTPGMVTRAGEFDGHAGWWVSHDSGRGRVLTALGRDEQWVASRLNVLVNRTSVGVVKGRMVYRWDIEHPWPGGG